MGCLGYEWRARSSAVERPAHNRLVVGSNPAGPTNKAHGIDANECEIDDIGVMTRCC